MKILLAVDGSEYTKKMLAYLVTHENIFQREHTEIVILNVQPLLPPHAAATVGKAAVEQYYVEESNKVLNPIAAFLERHNIPASSKWESGHASTVIAHAATEGKFDMVIMGSHGHGTIVNLVMGSVTTQVLAQCKVPVLLIR